MSRILFCRNFYLGREIMIMAMASGDNFESFITRHSTATREKTNLPKHWWLEPPMALGIDIRQVLHGSGEAFHHGY